MELKQPIPNRFELSGGIKVVVLFIYPEIAQVIVNLDGKKKRGYIRYVSNPNVCISRLQALHPKSLLQLLESCKFISIKTQDEKFIQVRETQGGVLVRKIPAKGIIKSYNISWEFLISQYNIYNLQALIFHIKQTNYSQVLKYLRIDLDEP